MKIEEIAMLKELYEEAFDDDPCFVNCFFGGALGRARVYKTEREGKIVSALYVFDKKLSYFGKTLKLPFISALATKKEYRGKGCAEEVMRAALEAEAKLGAPFIALSPVDENYYKKYGFTTVERESEIRLTASEEYFANGSADVGAFFEIYRENVKNYDICLKKTAAELSPERYGCDASYLLKRRSGENAGFVFFDGERTELAVSEISGCAGLEGKIIAVKSENGDARAKTMWRISNFESAFKTAFLSEIDAKIRIKDPFSGDKTLEISSKKGKNTVKTGVFSEKECDFSAEIGDLNALFAGLDAKSPLSPYFKKGSFWLCDKF